MPVFLQVAIPIAAFLIGIGGGIYLERHKPKWATFLRSKYHEIR